jgi:hypothetical protein
MLPAHSVTSARHPADGKPSACEALRPFTQLLQADGFPEAAGGLWGSAPSALTLQLDSLAGSFSSGLAQVALQFWSGSVDALDRRRGDDRGNDRRQPQPQQAPGTFAEASSRRRERPGCSAKTGPVGRNSSRWARMRTVAISALAGSRSPSHGVAEDRSRQPGEYAMFAAHQAAGM